VTLQERRELLEAELREIRATPCARCGHRFGDHDRESELVRVRCWGDGLKRGQSCSCARFVEVGEVLA
jgi:hypothetical protein